MSFRKESVCPLSTENTVTDRTSDGYPTGSSGTGVYPFALVLRLRVLQVVCGISALVMGAVAFIEERGDLNLAFAVPAGCATVLAAAASIHTSRGFSGYQPSTCRTSSALRFLGPSLRVAAPLAVLWAVACSLHATLVFHAIRTLAGTRYGKQSGHTAIPT
ncbi:hypothetical protein B7P43_G13391 [Cryptotermes secundus]|uniref:Uncharacterized protein n=1 Tax=Cryptotermes secundus TaxID=105785 RepID=A0A2J7RKU5_9NEOP|nr:hypothetical protein B7P43_G13391 [Cryptotermes secundus]